MLDVNGRRCVIVGGGAVALRRARSLFDAGAHVIVVAPEIDPAIEMIGEDGFKVELRKRPFTPDDLNDAFMVITATNVQRVNNEVDHVARKKGVIINRSDAAELSDLTFMASHRQGPLTICVHTGGASASAATKIRDTLIQQLDPDWQTLLEKAYETRDSVTQIVDPVLRRETLLSLVDEKAMQALKDKGLGGLTEHYSKLMNKAWQDADKK